MDLHVWKQYITNKHPFVLHIRNHNFPACEKSRYICLSIDVSTVLGWILPRKERLSSLGSWGSLDPHGIYEPTFSWTMIFFFFLKTCPSQAVSATFILQAGPPHHLLVRCHRWEAVQVHLGGLWLEVRALWRADPPLPEAHGGQAIPVRRVQPQLLPLRPPGPAHEEAPELRAPLWPAVPMQSTLTFCSSFGKSFKLQT